MLISEQSHWIGGEYNYKNNDIIKIILIQLQSLKDPTETVSGEKRKKEVNLQIFAVQKESITHAKVMKSMLCVKTVIWPMEITINVTASVKL